MISRGFARYHLCEGLLAAATESNSDEDSSRRAHARAKMRLMSMSRKELRDLAELTSSFLDRPVKVSYQELKRAIAQHRENAGEWVNDLKIDWDPTGGDKMPVRILIVGGDPRLVKKFVSALVRDGFSVAHVADYPEALLKVHDFKPDLIIVDEALPGRCGREVCSQLGGTLGVPVCMLREVRSGWTTLRALEIAGTPCLEKRDNLELVAGVRAVLQRYKEQRSDRKEKSSRVA